MAAHAKRVIRMRDGEIYEDVRQAALSGPPPRSPARRAHPGNELSRT